MSSTNGISSTPSESQLIRLPNELISEVAPYLTKFNHLNALIRTSRFFHTMFNSRLVRRAVDGNERVLDGIVRYVLSRDRLSSLTLLLDNGLSVNHIGKFGGDRHEQLMLRFVCKLDDHKSSVALARLLIQRGANMEGQDVQPWCPGTVLYNAIDQNNVEIAELLLLHGANANVTHTGGDTPIHCASARDRNNVLDEMPGRGYPVMVVQRVADLLNTVAIEAQL